MPKKTKLVSLLLVATALSISGNIYAEIAPVKPGVDFVQQDGKATGTVVDAFGPVVGASVLVKGTTNGNITDLDGNFTLEGVNNGDIIVISYIGYVTQEIPFTGQPINVTLAEDSEQLEEVVVTALGIKRSEKSLGYAMQQVGGDDLVQAREPNIANALTGKVSGVQIIRSSNGAGGSSKIQLRGSNSVTGLNQPLIVVDGVPMDNFTGADNNDYWNPSIDYGNGLSDLNAEDIESMSVLKGASAAALYGSRAGNGVILITTKSGRENPGLGITISASVSAETIFMKPERQSTFGQGTQGNFNPTSGYSWGPRIEGQSYTDWEGVSRNMQYYDNLDNYQAPSRMEEFIVKLANYHHIKGDTLYCTSDKNDSTVICTAYVFEDTNETSLFRQLLLAVCWYDDKTPGYLLNCSQQQFFFFLKDMRIGLKYLWIAERVKDKILLYTTRSPLDTEVSSEYFMEYRDKISNTSNYLKSKEL